MYKVKLLCYYKIYTSNDGLNERELNAQQKPSELLTIRNNLSQLTNDPSHTQPDIIV